MWAAPWVRHEPTMLRFSSWPRSRVCRSRPDPLDRVMASIAGSTAEIVEIPLSFTHGQHPNVGDREVGVARFPEVCAHQHPWRCQSQRLRPAGSAAGYLPPNAPPQKHRAVYKPHAFDRPKRGGQNRRTSNRTSDTPSLPRGFSLGWRDAWWWRSLGDLGGHPAKVRLRLPDSSSQLAMAWIGAFWRWTAMRFLRSWSPTVAYESGSCARGSGLSCLVGCTVAALGQHRGVSAASPQIAACHVVRARACPTPAHHARTLVWRFVGARCLAAARASHRGLKVGLLHTCFVPAHPGQRCMWGQ